MISTSTKEEARELAEIENLTSELMEFISSKGLDNAPFRLNAALLAAMLANMANPEFEAWDFENLAEIFSGLAEGFKVEPLKLCH